MSFIPFIYFSFTKQTTGQGGKVLYRLISVSINTRTARPRLHPHPRPHPRPPPRPSSEHTSILRNTNIQFSDSYSFTFFFFLFFFCPNQSHATAESGPSCFYTLAFTPQELRHKLTWQTQNQRKTEKHTHILLPFHCKTRLK